MLLLSGFDGVSESAVAMPLAFVDRASVWLRSSDGVNSSMNYSRIEIKSQTRRPTTVPLLSIEARFRPRLNGSGSTLGFFGGLCRVLDCGLCC